jgi:hypothetical protein
MSDTKEVKNTEEVVDAETQEVEIEIVEEGKKEEKSKPVEKKERKVTIDPDADKVEEYFQAKKVLKTLRQDLKDITSQHEKYEDLQAINKKVKAIRDDINDDEEIRELKDKISFEKERMDILKEMIRIELIENAEEKVVKDGKALKLIYIIKEARDED